MIFPPGCMFSSGPISVGNFLLLLPAEPNIPSEVDHGCIHVVIPADRVVIPADRGEVVSVRGIRKTGHPRQNLLNTRCNRTSVPSRVTQTSGQHRRDRTHNGVARSAGSQSGSYSGCVPRHHRSRWKHRSIRVSPLSAQCTESRRSRFAERFTRHVELRDTLRQSTIHGTRCSHSENPFRGHRTKVWSRDYWAGNVLNARSDILQV